MKRILNILLIAFDILGHAAVGIFVTNRFLIGAPETRGKFLMLLAHMGAWPLAGLVQALRSGGFSGFALSLLRPTSWRWAWRFLFTLLGARWLIQEIYRKFHPRPCPPEVLSTHVQDADMRDLVLDAEGEPTTGPKGLFNRANQIYSLEIVTREVRLDRLPPQFDGFTIVQLTDHHYGRFTSKEFVRRYVDLSIQIDPDLIALTGDYQTYSRDVEDGIKLLHPIGEWSQRERGGMGAFTVLGNHDRAAGTAHVMDALRRAGIKILNNRHVRLERDGASLYIVGVADPWSVRGDLDRALYGMPEGSCTILLAHVPDFLIDSAEAGVDLQLSGHNHGGQIKLPFLGAILVASRYGRRYAEGFYKRKRTLMYASRGLGGKPPVRFGSKPEITKFILRSPGVRPYI